MASSRVGLMISTEGPSPGRRSFCRARWAKMGTKKAAVLPVPV